MNTLCSYILQMLTLCVQTRRFHETDKSVEKSNNYKAKSKMAKSNGRSGRVKNCRQFSLRQKAKGAVASSVSGPRPIFDTLFVSRRGKSPGIQRCVPLVSVLAYSPSVQPYSLAVPSVSLFRIISFESTIMGRRRHAGHVFAKVCAPNTKATWQIGSIPLVAGWKKPASDIMSLRVLLVGCLAVSFLPSFLPFLSPFHPLLFLVSRGGGLRLRDAPLGRKGTQG